MSDFWYRDPPNLPPYRAVEQPDGTFRPPALWMQGELTFTISRDDMADWYRIFDPEPWRWTVTTVD